MGSSRVSTLTKKQKQLKIEILGRSAAGVWFTLALFVTLRVWMCECGLALSRIIVLVPKITAIAMPACVHL